MTPTTRKEWRDAFADWVEATGLSLRDIRDVMGLASADAPAKWLRYGRIPYRIDVRNRIHEVCAIDLSVLVQRARENAAAAKADTERKDYVRAYETYGRGGVPKPDAPTRDEVKAGYAALRKAGGYWKHNVATPTKGARFVHRPSTGYMPTQSVLAEV